MNSRMPIPTRLSWAILVWNGLIIGWVVTGHRGVVGRGGEGRVLVIIMIVILWLAGNAILGGARLVAARRHKIGA